jgi:opacity protein-like surface antigen
MSVRTVILAFASTVLCCGSVLQAQQNDSLHASVIPDAEASYANSPVDAMPVIGNEISTDPGGAPSPQGGTGETTPVPPASDNQWHIDVSPYLWFPGVHGTIGAQGHNLDYSASPGDLLSHFRFGLMGAVEARRNRLVTTIDMMWIRLADDKALPFPNTGANSGTIKMTEFLLTPSVGYRLIDGKMFKADAMAGIRYWHFGENLTFSPSILGLNFSKSQNWVDPVVGGRIETALSPKVGITVLGDVGGWGTGSQLEYQVGGLLGYKVKPKWTLQAGYRYLYVDYEKGGGRDAFIKATTSGVIFGVTVNLK